MDSINKLKFVCISDSHTYADKVVLPKGDVLIHAGDFTYTGCPWEVSDFNDFLRNSKFEVKIVIAGNHELTFDVNNYEQKLKHRFQKHRNQSYNAQQVKSLLQDCIYLEDSSYKLQGINIYGSPYTQLYSKWAFHLQTKEKSIQKWQQIPTETDILITHGGPYEIMDFEPSSPETHEGDIYLKQQILERVKPKYHIFGHSHGGYGITKIDNTTFINCSILNEHNQLVPSYHKPICFDYEISSQ
ncbi:hypothetical protein ABPG72_016610 [Tetrahymena utriculariae]